MQNQIQSTDTVYQGNFDILSELTYEEISNAALMLIQQNGMTATDLTKVTMANLKKFVNDKDFSFQELKDISSIDFDENEMGLVYAFITDNVSIDVSTANKAQNVILFYNSTGADLDVTIESITDNSSKETIYDGWYGTNKVSVPNGCCVKTNFIVNIPNSSEAYKTVVYAENPMEIVI